ncbi:hypothetical protein Pyrfu_1242 [Pyrolobus fumarii 1A]|uniref:Uncharacterized protein n=1 Tax=Pyrolobus fumarii (strain DSM 11204 / 1A) TaxID=694429 RepID=G0EG00_PYRF1|nr:hypothetical protein [Pyrolobus fumarii]AEM39101.1 hypothetical protein Pyrfu_1242 [Pyrolobus fumarii 1A]
MALQRDVNAVLVVPSFYHNVVSMDLGSVLEAQYGVRIAGVFLPAQICRQDRGSYVCDFERTELEGSILYTNVKNQLVKLQRVSGVLEQLGYRISTVVVHTELRMPLWSEGWFRKLYARLLSVLPSLLEEAGIDAKHVVVEMHPGFNEPQCYSRVQLDRSCVDVGRHAGMIVDAIGDLLESCPSGVECMFTIENRSGSPTQVRRYGNIVEISGFTSRRPQALASFYDVLEEIRIVSRAAKETLGGVPVGATLDIPQHLRGLYRQLPKEQKGILGVAKEELDRLLEKLASTARELGMPVLRSLHIHWFGSRSNGVPETHAALTNEVFREIYVKLSNWLRVETPRVVQKPLLMVPEALPGRGGKNQEIIDTMIYTAKLVSTINEGR